MSWIFPDPVPNDMKNNATTLQFDAGISADDWPTYVNYNAEKESQPSKFNMT